MDDRRAALLLAALALAGAGTRLVLVRPGAPPGEVRFDASPAPRAPLRDVAERAERLSRPLQPGERIDVDMADATELTRLPRVGPVLAQRIVAWRGVHGPFGGYGGERALARLDSVPGIGPKLLETLRPHVHFSGRRP